MLSALMLQPIDLVNEYLASDDLQNNQTKEISGRNFSEKNLLTTYSNPSGLPLRE